MVDFWNERYGKAEYAYGTEPNAFLCEQLKDLEPGRIILPGDGEGRNAVYAASLGWEVFAFDPSREGRKKAMALAQSCGVSIDFQTGTADTITWPREPFDLAAFCYVHLPSVARTRLHRHVWETLRSGGLMVMEYFSPKQLGLQSGGPKDLDMLPSVDDIRQDIPEGQFLILEEVETTLHEGIFHQGRAQVVRAVIRKDQA